MEALRLNPNNTSAQEALDHIRPLLAGQNLNPQPLMIRVAYFPTGAPRKIVQGRMDSSGNFIPDGIDADFYENGRLKRFQDIDLGKAIGLDITWDEDGKLLSRQVRN